MEGLFASTRERRLWAWTAAVVVTIFATLGLARTLSDELRDRQLADSTFFLGMVLVAATIVALAFRARSGTREVGVLIGFAAVYVLLFARMATPEERTHLIEYSVVALLIHEALTERVRAGRDVAHPAIVAAVLASMIGVVDESIQALIPSRVFDPVDILFNVLAASTAVAARVVLERVRR